jgi:hypothetical protein
MIAAFIILRVLGYCTAKKQKHSTVSAAEVAAFLILLFAFIYLFLQGKRLETPIPNSLKSTSSLKANMIAPLLG